ncbi:MAG: hypothetical protein AABW83_02570 [Nanoarchaeota archaeon]
MEIAFIGDVHGKIDLMYSLISDIRRTHDHNVDSVFQIGDFHAIRDKDDLKHFPVKEKYRTLGDFPKYFEGGRVPIKTYFIGGNHENNFWHSQHPEGHELIGGLNYLGRSGIKNIQDINLAWVSGNYSKKDFSESNSKKRKYNHFTKEDLDIILHQSNGEKIDVLMLHDWPAIRELEKHISGDVQNPENL